MRHSAVTPAQRARTRRTAIGVTAPREVLNTLADDLDDDEYLTAAGHQMTYLKDVCQVDPANPANLPTPTG